MRKENLVNPFKDKYPHYLSFSMTVLLLALTFFLSMIISLQSQKIKKGSEKIEQRLTEEQDIQESEDIDNWKTYTATLFSFKYPPEMTAGMPSANNNVSIWGPSNEKSVEEILSFEKSDENTQVSDVRKLKIGNKTAYVQKIFRTSDYYEALYQTKVIIPDVKYFDLGNWFENGILVFEIFITHVKNRNDIEAEKTSNTIISTINLVNIDQQGGSVSLSLKYLQFNIPKTWWFEYGINDTFKNEYYKVNTKTNSQPLSPHRDYVSPDTQYEIGFSPNKEITDLANQKYFSSTKKQAIIIDNINGLRIERTVSKDPSLNLNNWRYGPEDVVGTVQIVRSEGIYTLEGNITNIEQRKQFDQILSTFKFLDKSDITISHEISTWPIYQSSYKFEFRYPKSYIYQETGGEGTTSDNLTSIADFKTSDGKRMEILLDYTSFSLDYLKKFAPTGNEDIKADTQNFAGKTFYYYGPGGGGVCYPDQYFFNLGGKILIFRFSGCENDKTPPENTKIIERQILSTFKFMG